MSLNPGKSDWLISGQQWAEERKNDLLEAWQVRDFAHLFTFFLVVHFPFFNLDLISKFLALQILQTSHEQRRLPSRTDFNNNVMLTSLGALLLPNLLVILASRKGRKLIFDTVETILAIILIILLLSIVLGLPIGESCKPAAWLSPTQLID